MIIKNKATAEGETLKGISIVFGYDIKEILNGAMDVASNKAKMFPEEFDNLALTDEDTAYIERFLKTTASGVFTTLSGYAKGIENAYRYGVLPDSEPVVAPDVIDKPTSKYIRYEFLQHYLGDKNLFPVIDNHFENALMIGVVIDWFKFRIKGDLLQFLNEEFEGHIMGVKINFDKRISPIRSYGNFM